MVAMKVTLVIASVLLLQLSGTSFVMAGSFFPDFGSGSFNPLAVAQPYIGQAESFSKNAIDTTKSFSSTGIGAVGDHLSSVGFGQETLNSYNDFAYKPAEAFVDQGYGLFNKFANYGETVSTESTTTASESFDQSEFNTEIDV